jgi:hypothetical protein
MMGWLQWTGVRAPILAVFPRFSLTLNSGQVIPSEAILL